MGIAYLLKLLYDDDVLVKIVDLKTWKESTSWKKPNTCTIGVDGYNWVYKVVRSSIQTSGEAAIIELGKKFMSKVKHLRSCGFTPYIVFDGNKLPIKEETTNSKGYSKQQTMELQYAQDGDDMIDDAYAFDLKLSRVTHGIVYSIIQTLKRNKVEFVVAPYEADPQLAFLLLKHHVDVILTADADLILYGCKKIIFDYEHNYYEYDSSRLNDGKLFGGITKEMVFQACMLSGCDYLSKLPGVNLQSAIDFMKKRKDMICENDYQEVLKDLKPINVKENEMKDYIGRLIKAMNTYRHQRVYDPMIKEIVCLNAFPHETIDDQPYIGSHISPDSAEDIANGIIHPITKKRMKANNYIVGGYVYSQLELIDEVELERNLEMERLFRTASTLKPLQEAMFNAANDHFIRQGKQILTDKKVSEACQNSEVSKQVGSSFQDMSKQKIKEAEKYTKELAEKVIEPLNRLINDASLKDALDGAEDYSRARQEAEFQDEQALLKTLKQILETSSLKTYEALLSVEKNHRNQTSTTLVDLSELECSSTILIYILKYLRKHIVVFKFISSLKAEF